MKFELGTDSSKNEYLPSPHEQSMYSKLSCTFQRTDLNKRLELRFHAEANAYNAYKLRISWRCHSWNLRCPQDRDSKMAWHFRFSGESWFMQYLLQIEWIYKGHLCQWIKIPSLQSEIWEIWVSAKVAGLLEIHWTSRKDVSASKFGDWWWSPSVNCKFPRGWLG